MVAVGVIEVVELAVTVLCTIVVADNKVLVVVVVFPFFP